MNDFAFEHTEDILQGIEEQEEGDIDDEEEYEENGEMASGDLDGKHLEVSQFLIDFLRNPQGKALCSPGCLMFCNVCSRASHGQGPVVWSSMLAE